MNFKSVPDVFVFRGIFVVVCILSIGVKVTIAMPRIHALRAMNSGLRRLARNANRTPVEPYISHERTFTRFPVIDRSSNHQFVPAQPMWNRSISSWPSPPGGNSSGKISKTNGDDDVKNNTYSDVHHSETNNHQGDARKLTEGGDVDDVYSTSKGPPARQSESAIRIIDVRRIAVTKENETRNIINGDGGETPIVKRIEDGGPVDINVIDYPIFKSHKTYVIQDNNPKLPTTYYWIGKESSDKDAGEAAAQAVRMDSQVRKKISVSREAEEKESPNFRALFEHFKHDVNLPKGLSNVREELPTSELKNILEEQQINVIHHNLTLENLQRNLDQTKIEDQLPHEKGHKRFDIEIFRIYGKHEWTLTDWSVKDERSIYHHVPIQTLNSENCYLTDSHSNVGLVVWMGEKAGTLVRAESARKAELHLRRRKYDYATPITLLNQEDVPPQVETLEELVHFIEPLIIDDMFMNERESQVIYNAFKNDYDHNKHSSSSSSTDDNKY